MNCENGIGSNNRHGSILSRPGRWCRRALDEDDRFAWSHRDGRSHLSLSARRRVYSVLPVRVAVVREGLCGPNDADGSRLSGAHRTSSVLGPRDREIQVKLSGFDVWFLGGESLAFGVVVQSGLDVVECSV